MTVLVECPTCKRRTEYTPENRWRPFCSQRCKLIDLGAWASGQYSIPGGEPDPQRDPAPDPDDER